MTGSIDESQLTQLTKKTNDKSSEDNVKISCKVDDQCKFMHRICKSICRSTIDYNPEKTIITLKKYINSNKDDKGNRLLYSEISKFIFELNEEQFGMFQTNIDALAEYSLRSSELNNDLKRLVMKIWDHVHLVMAQKDRFENDKEFVNSVLQQNIEQINSDLQEKFLDNNKNLINQNITILGIFSAVVLAFTGGMAFSTSVFSNINKVSIYRLSFVIIILGAVLANIIYILLSYISKINHIDNKKEKLTPEMFKDSKCVWCSKQRIKLSQCGAIVKINIAFLVAMIILIGCYEININKINHEHSQVSETNQNVDVQINN